MVNEHFRALKNAYRADESPKRFCDGIIPAGRVEHLLRPDATTVQPLTAQNVELIAAALGCTSDEVMEANCRDAGTPYDRLVAAATAEQRDAVVVVRNLTPHQQETVAGMDAAHLGGVLDALGELSADQIDTFVKLGDRVGSLLDAAHDMTGRQLSAVLTFMREMSG